MQVSIQRDTLTVACHGSQGHNVTLTSLVVKITSVSVHRSGALNLTGEWIPLNDTPRTLDILQLTSVMQLGSTTVKEGTINIGRIDVASATASSNNGPLNLVVSSDHLQANPNVQVNGGMTATIIGTLSVVSQRNVTLRLTPASP